MDRSEREQEMTAIVDFWMKEMEKAGAQGDKLRFFRAKQMHELAKLLNLSLRQG